MTAKVNESPEVRRGCCYCGEKCNKKERSARRREKEGQQKPSAGQWWARTTESLRATAGEGELATNKGTQTKRGKAGLQVRSSIRALVK